MKMPGRRAIRRYSPTVLIVSLIWSVAVSSSGFGQSAPLPVAATGGADHVVTIFDAAGKETRHFLAHDAAITCMAFSPDGRRLYTGSDDKTIRVWTVEDATLENTIEAHDKAVTCLAVSPDGKILASGGADSLVRFWNPMTGRLILTIRAHSQAVRAVAWSPDGKLLASAGADRLVQIWRVDGSAVGSMVGHDEPVLAVAWSQDGATVSSCSSDGAMRVWRVGDMSVVQRYRSPDKQLAAVALARDGQTAVTLSRDGKLRVVALGAAGAASEVASGPGERAAGGIAVGPDGKVIVRGGADRTVTYCGRDLSILIRVQAHDGAIPSVAILYPPVKSSEGGVR